MNDQFKTNTRDTNFPYITEKTDETVIAALMVKLNASFSVATVERITSLDKTNQYRKRLNGTFPQLVNLSQQGRRKAYRIADLKKWLADSVNLKQIVK